MTDRSNSARARQGLVKAYNRDLRVSVPDPLRGYMLVQRLPGSELTGSTADGWIVAGYANGDLRTVLSSIQEWLRDEGIAMTDVDLGGHSHTMTRA